MDLLLRIKWRPEIGDPTFMGWFTVVAYGVAALLAWRAWSARRERIWLGTAVLMVLLCVNKQFDLQSLFTDIGREIARHGGWYEDRRLVQKGFVLAVLAGAGVFGGWFVWRFREFLAHHKLLVAGLFLLLMFIVVRAISFTRGCFSQEWDRGVEDELVAGTRGNFAGWRCGLPRCLV